MEPCSKTQGVMLLPRLNWRKGEKGILCFPLRHLLLEADIAWRSFDPMDLYITCDGEA